MNVGIESWAYHRWFGDLYPWEQPVGARWTIDQFVCHAAELGAGAVAIQSIHVGDTSPEALGQLRSTLEQLALRPTLSWGHSDGLRGGASPERERELHKALELASALGARMVRVVCGDHGSWREPAALRKRALTPMLKRAAEAAAARGLELAVENDADLTAADLADLIRSVRAPNVGVCFDDGNAVRIGEDPLRAAELLACLVRMVHLKDLIVLPESVGDPAAWWPTVPLGRGELDLHGILDRLVADGFDGCVFVELSAMHPSWPDEDEAVREGLAFLRARLCR